MERKTSENNLRNQVFVHEALLVHAPNDGFHLVDRVEIPEVMPADKLPDVAVQVLLADLVERPLVRPLQHRPEALNAVRVRHAVDVLPDAVLHRVEVVDVLEAGIGPVVIRVEGRAEQKRCPVRNPCKVSASALSGTTSRFDLAGLAVFRSNDRHLANTAAPCMELSCWSACSFQGPRRTSHRPRRGRRTRRHRFRKTPGHAESETMRFSASCPIRGESSCSILP